MKSHFLVALVLLIAIVGCSNRYRPLIVDERPAVPTEQQAMIDLQASHGQFVDVEIESEIISVDARVFVVIVGKDSESPVLYKVSYYLLDANWICVSERIEL